MQLGPFALANDQLVFGHLDGLMFTVCNLEKIEDADWLAYLEKATDVQRDNQAIVACIHFKRATLNATQRRQSKEFIEAHKTPATKRTVVLTDSVLIQGAMTAFSYFMPRFNFRAFSPEPLEAPLRWLAEAHPFDVTAALALSREIYARVR